MDSIGICRRRYALESDPEGIICGYSKDGAVNTKLLHDNTMKANIASHILMFWLKILGSQYLHHTPLLELHRMDLCFVAAVVLVY